MQNHTDSSIKVAKFLRYSKAVRTFIVDFFFFAAGDVPRILRIRLSDIVCRPRPLEYLPLPSSASSPAKRAGSA